MNKHPQKSDNPLLKECLFTALIMLMDQKDFKSITISEITQKAGVSRMTYYRTYSSKEDILRQHFNDQSQKVMDELSKHPDLSTYESFCIYFKFVKDQAHLIEYLYRADLLREVLQKFTSYVAEMYEKAEGHETNEPIKSYEISFIAGGLSLLMFHWIERGLKETPEEMARITVHMIRASASEPEKGDI